MLDVVKKTVYDKLAAKVNSIDTSGFFLETKYETDKTKLENKISDTIGLVKKTDCNATNAEIENEIPSFSGPATNTALTTVENKIPIISSLVKGTDYNTKLRKLKRNLLIMTMINILLPQSIITQIARVFTARLAKANVVAKTDFDNKLRSLNQKLNSK